MIALAAVVAAAVTAAWARVKPIPITIRGQGREFTGTLTDWRVAGYGSDGNAEVDLTVTAATSYVLPVFDPYPATTPRETA